MDFTIPVAYNPAAKAAFLGGARKQLKGLAQSLGLFPGSYDLRVNQAGIAVSGEVTLHSDSIYVQVQQSCMGSEQSILIRRVQSRKDYRGGTNHFASLRLLNDLPSLAAVVKGATS